MPRVTRSKIRPEDIRALRQHHNLSQLDLASMIGVGQSMVSQWESGKAGISESVGILMELAVCQALECDRGCLDPMESPRQKWRKHACAETTPDGTRCSHSVYGDGSAKCGHHSGYYRRGGA